jgi:hypothetical protein
MHITATAVTKAGVGAPFNSPEADWNEAYDGTAFDGIVLYAKADQAMYANVEVHTVSTEYAEYGGTCIDSVCNSNYMSVLLDTDWQSYVIPFDSLTGGGSLFSASELLNVHLVGGAGSYELWMDDPTFYVE